MWRTSCTAPRMISHKSSESCWPAKGTWRNLQRLRSARTCEKLRFFIGKSSTNGPFSIATLDSQRIPVGTTWCAKAAMDAVNVDLDEMRARVDSTHSIITSRQRVEAGYKRIKKDSTKSNCNSLLCKSFFEHKLWQIIVHIHTQISRQRGVTIAILLSDFWLAYLKPWT